MRTGRWTALVRAVFFEHVPHHLEQPASGGDDRGLRRFVHAAVSEVRREVGVESDCYPGRFHQGRRSGSSAVVDDMHLRVSLVVIYSCVNAGGR